MKKVLHVIQWIAAVFVAFFSIVCFSAGGMGVLGGFLLLGAAFMISPLPSKIPAFAAIPKGKAAVQIGGCFMLFILGAIVTPSKPEPEEAIDRSMPKIVETDTTLVTTAAEITTTAAAVTPTTTAETTTTTADTPTETTTTTTAETTTTAAETTTKAKKTTTAKPKPTTTTTTTQETTTTTTTTVTTTTEPEKIAMSYVANTNTKKFHYSSCSSVEDIQPGNRWDFVGDRAELIAQGYQPCKRCNP